tara:strand:+ start:292 stop:657 length:366 start_codon:yes stop_codon:yes gene_type:complete
MKPTQEQILSALNKLVRENKTELKAEKIELNAVEDTIKAAAKIGGKVISKESDILGLAGDIVKLANGYGEYIKELKGFEKQAKELGVDKLAKDASEAITFYNNKIKRADKMLSAVKTAIKR